MAAKNTNRSLLSFLAVAYGFFVVMTGTTLPTPLYALYQEEFGFGALMVTILFAIYALVVVAVLLLFGRLSDDIGRRPVLVAAAVASLLSAVAFLLADSVAVLMLGRVLSGVSAGLVTGTATATLLDLGGHEHRARSATIAVAVTSIGLGFGTTFCGLIAEWSSDPLTVPFVINLAMTAIGLIAFLSYRSPDSTSARRFRINVQRPTVPVEVRASFARTSLAAGCGFAVTGVLTAVISLFLAQELDIHSHLLAGAIVGLALTNIAVGQIVVKRLKNAVALQLGCAGLVISSALIATALALPALWPMITGAVLVGISCGLCTGAGLRAIGTQARPEHRGVVSSTFFAVTYTMLSLPVIAVGFLEKATSLTTAGITFSAIVALLAAGMLISMRTPQPT